MIKKELNKVFFVALPMVLAPLLNMVFMILVARNVEVEYYGSFSYVLALIAILIGFSDLGLRDYLLSKDGLTKPYSNVSMLFLFSLLMFFIICVLEFFFWIDANELAIFNILILEALGLGVFYKALYYNYQASNRLTYFSKVEIFIKVLPVLLKILLFIIFKDLLLSLFFGSVTTLFIYFIWLTTQAGLFFYIECIRVEVNNLKILIADWKSWSVFSVSFVSFFLYFGADKIVVNHVLGAGELAIYTASMSFMALGQIAVGVLWSLYMPRLSRGERLWGDKHFLFLLFFFGLLMIAFYQVFAWYLFGEFYPNEYAYGEVVLSIASLYFAFRFPNVVLEILYITDGVYLRFVKMRIFFGVLALVMCFLLLPTIGVIGASISLVMAEMFLTVGSILGRRRSLC